MMTLQKLRDSRLKTEPMDRTQPRDELTDLVAELFERYHTAIFAYLYRLVGEREWAHDLTQEAFLRVFQARERLPQVENHRAWVYRIASNTAFNALKRRRRFAWLPWRQDDGSGEGAEIPPVPGPAEGSERRLAVEEALAELPPHYRAPLLLYSHYGLSVCEVAQALEISPGAVKTRLCRAREMFRQAFQGESER